MQQPSVVAYVKPSIAPKRPYHGAQIGRRRRLKMLKGGPPEAGGLPVRSREEILSMVGRKV